MICACVIFDHSSRLIILQHTRVLVLLLVPAIVGITSTAAQGIPHSSYPRALHVLNHYFTVSNHSPNLIHLPHIMHNAPDVRRLTRAKEPGRLPEGGRRGPVSRSGRSPAHPNMFWRNVVELEPAGRGRVRLWASQDDSSCPCVR